MTAINKIIVVKYLRFPIVDPMFFRETQSPELL